MRCDYGKNLQLEDADPGALDASGWLFTLLPETRIWRSASIRSRHAFHPSIAWCCAA